MYTVNVPVSPVTVKAASIVLSLLTIHFEDSSWFFNFLNTLDSIIKLSLQNLLGS